MTQTAAPPASAMIAWTDLTPGDWLIDRHNSAAHFAVSRAYVSRIHGLLPVSGGLITVGADLGSSKINLALDPAGISTGSGDRDDLLRGPNFFDVISFPVWSFESTVIVRSADDLLVEGLATIHGQTHAISFTAQFAGVDQSQTGVPVVGFTATTRIDRRAFGLTWTAKQAGNHIHTGEKVALMVDLLASPVGADWAGGGIVEVFAE
ncbi:MAG: YceI family protein [Bifidobacteriaceae bacterium]|jgi:polyisoprenoid-binding protein YceI|nr:YceI family protein [Bifidobacteriaceae bacterium]